MASRWQAGERLLHDILARDAEETPGRARVPFDELLACVSRRQVVDEAERSWTGPGGKTGGPTESAFRYRWNTQAGFLRDLAIYSLRSRLASSGQSGNAASLLFGNETDAGISAFDEKIDQIAYHEVLNRALLPETKQVPPSAWPLDHDKRTSLLAKIAMAIIVAFTDPGDGEPLRHAVRRLGGAA